MNRTLCLILLGIIALGTPVFAQNDEDPASAGNSVHLGSASDDEFTNALETTSDVELVNEYEVMAPENPVSVEETPAGTAEPVLAEETPAGTAEPALAEETPADTEEPVLVEETPAGTEEPILAEETPAGTAEPVLAEETSADTEEQVIPYRIRNNYYFQESQRYARLAQGAYTFGDYDSSTNFAYESILYAGLSDEYVALQLKIREANNAIAAAKHRIDWAVSSGASRQFPVEYREAESWYNESLSARAAEEWDNAIDAAYKVIELLAYIDAPEGTIPLPARYTVRAWTTFKDCLWNIAGRPWVYGNPHQWRVLYNANRSKLPDPNNPNLIEPGMVLDIPSIKGEHRQGAWDGSRTYPPLR